ncbi:hypothetical protein GPALN_003275 [Globodera pallida]|nr:hypothetical protein GPALN_003275 [Globodera pallida]
MNEIESKRNKEKLRFDGFLYTFDKFNADNRIKFWRCEQKDECRGRIHTDLNNNFLKLVTAHTHESDVANVEAQKIITAVKRRAVACQDYEICSNYT